MVVAEAEPFSMSSRFCAPPSNIAVEAETLERATEVAEQLAAVVRRTLG